MHKKDDNQTTLGKKKFSLWAELTSFDLFFFVLVIILLCIGLVMMFSSSYASAYFKNNDSYYYIKKQLFWAAIGLAAMFIFSRINYNVWRIAALPLYAVSIILLVLVKFIGKGNYEEQRWLVIGGVNIQPSEIAKFAIILILAVYISINYSKMKKIYNGILIPGAIIGVAAVLILIEPHLSGTLLVVAVGFILLIIGGANLKFFAIAAVGATASVAIFVVMKSGYMMDRINIWLNPAADPLGKGFQPLQSLYAIGSGGIWGLGLGRSIQKYLYIPEPQNDYIFSIVCEELGFIGALIIIILFALLVYRGFVIAWSAPDKFGSLLVIGITTLVAIQILLNIAVVTNTVPPTGISLPFFSYGGTALTILLGEMGIILSVSRYSRLNKG